MTIDLDRLEALEKARLESPCDEIRFINAMIEDGTIKALIAVVRASQKVCATNFVQLGLLNELDEALQPFTKEG